MIEKYWERDLCIKMDYNEVKELIGIFEKTDLNDMEVRLGNDYLRLNRGKAPVMSAPPQMQTVPVMPSVMQNIMPEEPVADGNTAVQDRSVEPSETPAGKDTAKKGGKLITAPIVGTFYQSRSPGEEPFVKVGDKVSAGDVVCIIEAMKFMNEVNSEVAGTVTEILVEDGAFVEYGQELFRVE